MNALTLLTFLVSTLMLFPKAFAEEVPTYEGLCVKVVGREGNTTYYFGRYCYYPEIGQVCRESSVQCWDKVENPMVFKRLRKFICSKYEFLKKEKPKFFSRVCPDLK